MDGGLGLLLRGLGDGTFAPFGLARAVGRGGDAKSLAVTELNGDGWPDVVIGLNNEQPCAFEIAPTAAAGV